MAGAPAATITPTAWATDVLRAGGWPVTPTNIDNLLRWATLEGGNATDPLNVRNSSGGFGFSTVQEGIMQTAATIKQSNMAPISAALSQSVPVGTFSQAIASTPWDQGGYATQIQDYGSSFLNAFSPLSSFASGATLDSFKVPGAVTDLLDPAAAGASLGSSAGGGLASLSTLVTDLTDMSWWKRVGEFALGAAVFVGGAVLFMASTGPGQDAIKAAAVA